MKNPNFRTKRFLNKDQKCGLFPPGTSNRLLDAPSSLNSVSAFAELGAVLRNTLWALPSEMRETLLNLRTRWRLPRKPFSGTHPPTGAPGRENERVLVLTVTSPPTAALHAPEHHPPECFCLARKLKAFHRPVRISRRPFMCLLLSCEVGLSSPEPCLTLTAWDQCTAQGELTQAPPCKQAKSRATGHCC